MLVLRRLTAVLAMVAIVGLVILLMYDVYLHHSRGGSGEDATSVSILGRTA